MRVVMALRERVMGYEENNFIYTHTRDTNTDLKQLS